MITLQLSADHAREVMLAVKLRSRVIPCGLCKRLLDEVAAALKEFVLLGEPSQGVPAEGCAEPIPEKTAGPRVENRGAGH